MYKVEFKNYLGITTFIKEGTSQECFGDTATDTAVDSQASKLCLEVAKDNGCATIWKDGKVLATQNYLNI
jgi:hypothetical protein